MIKVDFYDSIDDSLLKFAVIVSRYEGKWVLCKHKERSTYEFPGGHREIGEDILVAAKRELYEETGATEYSMQQIGVYSVSSDQQAGGKEQTFGMLYFAEIFKLGALPGLKQLLKNGQPLPEELHTDNDGTHYKFKYTDMSKEDMEELLLYRKLKYLRQLKIV
jgi:8-oxo-dGTP diphosphatase